MIVIIGESPPTCTVLARSENKRNINCSLGSTTTSSTILIAKFPVPDVPNIEIDTDPDDGMISAELNVVPLAACADQ